MKIVGRLAMAGTAAPLLLALSLGSATAAPPTRTVEEVHVSTTFPAGTRCPFEVVRTIDGVLKTTTFTDGDGLQRQTQDFEGAKIGYLNPANGRTLQAVLAGPAVTIDNGDGTSTIRVPGNDQRYVAPGMGFIVGNTGLSIITVDNATGDVLSVDKLAGHQDGVTFPALCAGLG